jgi:hypothetical protein
MAPAKAHRLMEPESRSGRPGGRIRHAQLGIDLNPLQAIKAMARVLVSISPLKAATASVRFISRHSKGIGRGEHPTAFRQTYPPSNTSSKLLINHTNRYTSALFYPFSYPLAVE